MIIGTAGHIDHGKSALVEAITGKSMDPLAEEKRRGITLDLHFAPLALADGRIAGVIDVPGHEDLIRTMVAGAAGLDLVLLIVSADEGIMPQTREHLAIVEQLRVPAGIPVITKSDLVEPEWLTLVEAEVAQWLATSPVRFIAPVATSVVNRTGLAQLRALIESSSQGLRQRETEDLFRLPVDRAISLPGVGTVVTGTAWSGSLRVGDLVTLLPGEVEGRVRSLERHGEEVAISAPGERVAVGIAGLDRHEAHRGDVLVRRGDPWPASTAIDVAVELLPGAPRPLAHHSRVRLDLGTDEVMARVHSSRLISPGESGLVRLALERPLVCRGSDRFVLRSYSPVETIGGGRVLDSAPSPGRAQWPEGIADSDPAVRLRALVERRATGLELGSVPAVLGVAPRLVDQIVAESGLVRAGQMVVTRESVASATEAALQAVGEFHRSSPSQAGMQLETLRQSQSRRGVAAEYAIAQLILEGALIAEGSVVRAKAFQLKVAGRDQLVEKVVALIEAAGLTPPSLSELESALKTPGLPDALKAAVRSGRVEAVERERYFSSSALAGFRETVLRIGAAGPITPQLLRDETALSRKFLIPLLEWSDRMGITLRSGESRVLARRRTTPVGGA